jgi:HEAT repeat protein
MLASDPDPEVRQQACFALAPFDPTAAADWLLGSLEHQFPRLAGAARSRQERAVRGLEADDPDRRREAAEALGRLGPAAADAGPLLQARLKAEPEPGVRAEILEALRRIDPVAAAREFPLPAEFLLSRSDDVLNRLQQWKAKAYLADKKPGTRLAGVREAADAAPMGGDDLVRFTLAYQGETDPFVKAEWARALKRLDLDAAEKAGIPVTEDERADCWRRTAWRCRPGAADRAAALVLFGLQDGDPEVRADAAQALGRLGPFAREPFPAAAALYRNEGDPKVRDVLGQVLKTIDAEAARKAGVR